MKTTNADRSVRLPLMARWLTSHSSALLSSLGSMAQRPFTTFIAVLIIGIAIALPAGMRLLLTNLEQVSQNIETSPTVSLYLRPNTSQHQTNRLIKQIKEFKQVQRVVFISSQQGLKEFAQQTKLGDVIQQLKHNPLPAVIEVSPKANQQNPTALKTLQSQLQRLSGVTMTQLDSQWVTRLYNLVLIGKRLSMILTVLFSAAVVLIIGNTIRVTAHTYRQEIHVLRLFGASAPMVRRPLLYRGTCYGLAGGIMSWIIVEFSMLWIKTPTIALAQSYQTPLLLTRIPFTSGMVILLSGALLGWCGAWFAANHYLKTKE